MQAGQAPQREGGDDERGDRKGQAAEELTGRPRLLCLVERRAKMLHALGDHPFEGFPGQLVDIRQRRRTNAAREPTVTTVPSSKRCVSTGPNVPSPTMSSSSRTAPVTRSAGLRPTTMARKTTIGRLTKVSVAGEFDRVSAPVARKGGASAPGAACGAAA